ncbi:MAG: TraM recognition domain-containing protein, partial [Mycobacteriales bacterium]
SQLRWSPVNGCQEPLVALNRAAAFVSGAGVGEGVQNASYWTGVATAILRCYFLAAATSGRTITDVVRWSTQPTNPEPIQILRKMEQLGRAPQGWAGELESGASADGETRGNMWSGVRRALDCFADPKVLAACSPGPHDIFDVATFVSGRNTLYVLGKEKKNGSVAPLVTAMMEDIFDQVRKIASRMPNSRIDPPLTVELNEVAHIAPMPNLPGYMGDSGGFSIALHVYLQSLGQARGKWGNDEAAVMWDTAAIRVVMGGSGYVNDLEDISRLMGEVDEKTKSVSRGAGGKSTSYSKQKRRVLTLDELRTLEFGTAVIIARAARPVEARLTPYFRRKDAKEISAGQARVAKIIAAGDDGDMDALAPTGLLAPAGTNSGAGGSNGGFGGGSTGGFGGGSGMGSGNLMPPPAVASAGAGGQGYVSDPYGNGPGQYQGQPPQLQPTGFPQQGQASGWRSAPPVEPPRTWGGVGVPPAPESARQISGPTGWGGAQAPQVSSGSMSYPSGEPADFMPASPGPHQPSQPQADQASGWQAGQPMFQPSQQAAPPEYQAPQLAGPPQVQPIPVGYEPPPAEQERYPSATPSQPYQLQQPGHEASPQVQPNGPGGQYASYGDPYAVPPAQPQDSYASAPVRQSEPEPAPESERPAAAPRIPSGWGPARRTDQE